MTAFRIDPERLAKLETEMWRSYYAKEWGRVLYLTERTSALEFHVPVPLSLVAAYHATRAALAFKPVANDLRATHAALAAYYRVVRRFSGLAFDPSDVADAELRYWVVHRELSGAADHASLVGSLRDLHAALFGIAPDRATESAEWRAKAAITVDGITGGRSTDVARDWLVLEDQLGRCYRSLARAVGDDRAPMEDGA